MDRRFISFTISGGDNGHEVYVIKHYCDEQHLITRSEPFNPWGSKGIYKCNNCGWTFDPQKVEHG